MSNELDEMMQLWTINYFNGHYPRIEEDHLLFNQMFSIVQALKELTREVKDIPTGIAFDDLH